MPRCFCGSGRRPGHQSSPPPPPPPTRTKMFLQRAVGLFSQVGANSSPPRYSRPSCVHGGIRKGCWIHGSSSRDGQTNVPPPSPRGVTSAHGLRPRCLHDTGARSADCGPQKNQMEALFAAPAARKSLTRRHRANTAPLHGFTRGRSGRSNQDRQVQNESGLRSCSEF